MTLTTAAPERPPITATTDVRPRRIPYEPSLDGFRGLAVGAVVLYHGGVSWAAGGYLGVDAFFVLSGYLITSLLLAEWHDNEGIALLSFWGRRARRLVPALFVLLVGMALFCLFVAKPDNLGQLRGDGIASLFYVMNWRLILTGQSYFSQFFASPFEHMWSLAIEEQYYLFWPLITLGIMRWKRSALTMFRFCAGLAAVSATWMFVLSLLGADPSRLYYGTDTRVQSLLIGSALAAAIAAGFRIRTKVSRQLVLLAAVAGSLLLFVNWFSVPYEASPLHWESLPYTDPMLYHGGFLVFALLVALIIFVCTQLGPNPIRRALAFEPLRRLGLISYGVYLFHWPIYAWLNDERTGLELTSKKLLLLRLLVTLVVSYASYELLEKPIRDGVLRRIDLAPIFRRLIFPVSATLVLVLIVTSTAGAKRTTPTPDDFDPANRPPPAAAARAPDDSKVLLVGDSVAYTLGVGFEGEATEANHIAWWNQGVLFCELVRGAHRENDVVKEPSDTCTNWESDWRRDVEEFKPDATVLQLGAWEIFDRQINGKWIDFGTPEFDAILEPVLQRAVDALSSGGAPVVVLTTPRFTRTDGTSANEWLQNDVGRTDHFNDLLRRLAANNPTRVVLIDLGGFLCPANQCRPTIDGVAMRADGVHYRAEDAEVVARWLAPQLRAVAIDPAWHRGTESVTPSTPAPTVTSTGGPAGDPSTETPATSTSGAPAAPSTEAPTG